MKPFITLLILFCLVFGSSCVSSPPAKALIVLNKIEGFSLEDKPSIYEGADLYDYINTGAETYHDYGFVRVTSGKIGLGEETVIVDIYDMGNKTNAFGVFSSFRTPEAEYLTIGIESLYSSPTLYAYKGKYLIQLSGSKPSQGLKEKLVLIGRNIDDKIITDMDPPDKLNILLTKGRIPHTEYYTKNNIMGFHFLKEAWSADYILKGKKQSLIIMDMKNPQEAEQALKDLREEITNLENTTMQEADEALTCFDRFMGLILVCRKGNQIVYSASKDTQINLKPLVSEQLKNL